MKTANILLGVFALVTAAASAMASKLVTPPHYVNLLYTNPTEWKCTVVNTPCSGSGPICEVIVNGSFIAPVYDDIKPNGQGGFDLTTCINVLRDADEESPSITKPRTVIDVR